MISESPARQVPLSRTQWTVLALLVISAFINLVDRGNLSIAAPLLKEELSVSTSQLGMLLSAFFWTYAIFQLFGIAGWLVDRFNVYWVLAAGFLAWSLATAMTGAAQDFGLLFLLRLVLGIGESVAFPAYSKILATSFPEHHRGLANALIDGGSKLGPALGTLVGGVLVAFFGWRVFFIGVGAMSLVWLLPWFRSIPPGWSRVAIDSVRDAPGIVDILRLRSAWGTFVGLFCANYLYYFLLTWLPAYLIWERHLSMKRMAVVGSLAYCAAAASSTASGWLSDRWIASGASPTKSRKTFAATGLTCSTIILPVAVVSDHRLAMVLLILACLAIGMFSSQHWAITQTLAGRRAVGKWSSIQNGIANLAGVVAPWLAGFLLKETGSFYWPFAVAAAFALTGAAIYLFVVGPIVQVRFETE
jgi:MFS transporter, ACS family, D-galactonate transporter